MLITEVSLRDGLQIEPVIVPTADKLRFGKLLVDAGFQHLEIGSFVNPARVATMADTAEVVAGLADQPATCHTLVLNERGAQRAVEAGAKHVRLVMSASEGHSQSNSGVGTADAMQRLARAAEILHDAGIRTEGCIATAFVCPFDGDTPVERVVRVARHYADIGVDVLHLADTIGAASPRDINRAITAVRDVFPVERIGLHLHSTYGMADANAWEAYRCGIRRFDAALGGLGGCPFAPGATGNIAADDLIHLFHREGVDTGVDVTKLGALRDQLAELVGHALPSALAKVPAAPAPVRR
ncbi:hydroxymethylglutaryl-CoA lyase [Saccharopolyspora sp. K220]|uniref:hydroxymethylglutaryl-CoA lyase n=1 Tax=Saccharopolyspora soli TaxID=2926618 RepID=UPI001F5AD323|nr:hydroxymethylglutaryl-CoA lyase [Saccharopolyspora soli]MCI2416396.1 hydroxymethylglutaryl-CoA lyase [Saccharopolyspora soli]